MNRLIAYGLMGLFLLGSACSTASVTPSASVTTLQPVWPSYFRVEWAVQSAGSDRVAGYLYNTSGVPADHVQILAQALDASGGIVGQKIAWVTGVIPPYTRTFFGVGGLPAASTYHVSVWNFEIYQAESYH